VTGLEIDHVFVFTRPGAPEAAALEAAGLRESFRRAHPGQGTGNVCYCFDDAYLELLWVVDPDELASPAVAPTRLAERAAWERTGACPFGIALRGAGPMPFATWDYRAPFLPADMAIPVAEASADPAQPFLFRSPGTSRPDAWTDGRAGMRQAAAGLAGMGAVHLDVPAGVRPAPALAALERAGLLTVATGASAWSMRLSPARAGGGAPLRLALPGFAVAGFSVG
jgi:hypothetical protein